MEQSPSQGGVGPEHSTERYAKLPHYYQCLGRACAAAGMLNEFNAVLDAGMDYGQASAALRYELEQKVEATNLDAWLEHFGIPSAFEESEVE